MTRKAITKCKLYSKAYFQTAILSYKMLMQFTTHVLLQNGCYAKQ